MVRASVIWRKTDTMSAALSFMLFSSVVIVANGHQSISFPTPVSFDLTCRIGLGRNCPGPCPTRLMRSDQSPTKPAVTTRRGGVLPVHILKNNHVGGFARWSLVPISDMYSKTFHAQAAFMFTCADVKVTKCERENRERDCKVDRLNEYYRYQLRIPKVYPDGYYVLGWLWYGGLVSTGTHGAFGEYWDCVYVKIEGGPTEEEHQPMFHAGESLTGQHGMCKATTNRIGHCFREPCPFGNREGKFMKPEEFEGRSPSRIRKWEFEHVQGKKYELANDVTNKRPHWTNGNSTAHRPDSGGSILKKTIKPSPIPSQIPDMKQKEWFSVETKKASKKRKLLMKRLRKEKKMQQRRAKQERKAKARMEKHEKKRLRREWIKANKAKKREKKKMRRQRRKEMKKV